MRAVERLRRDFPLWGKAKIGPLLRRQGFAASEAAAGRILARLMARGAVQKARAAGRPALFRDGSIAAAASVPGCPTYADRR